jgi:hypothetical protein
MDYQKSSRKPDKKNSTYYCETIFESGNFMTGWSKMIGFTEPKDKETCLFNMYLRLFQLGYGQKGKSINTVGKEIEPVQCIVFFKNHVHQAVYTFYPHYAEPEYEAGWSLKFMEKIESFYKDLNRRMSVNDLMKKYYVSRTRPEKPKYQLDKPRFFSSQALEQYCLALISDGEEVGRVKKYKIDYSEKFFENGKLKPEWLSNTITN